MIWVAIVLWVLIGNLIYSVISGKDDTESEKKNNIALSVLGPISLVILGVAFLARGISRENHKNLGTTHSEDVRDYL